ncbi:hypothetical protein X924_09435 [Petrotoga sp. 9PWA.NaAc.5.4]|nr:hypothetical protein X924_09435 [Petrotoga sp. 9PWA.NaAc.5.4]
MVKETNSIFEKQQTLLKDFRNDNFRKMGPGRSPPLSFATRSEKVKKIQN